MLDRLFNLTYIKDIVHEKEINMNQLKLILESKNEFIEDLNLETLCEKIDICQTHFGTIQLRNQLKDPFNTSILDIQINTFIIQKSPKVVGLLDDLKSIQNTIINIAIVPEDHKTLISNLYFTDYFESLNKYEVAIQGHVLINLYGHLYNIISPLIIIIIPFVLSKIMPTHYVNMFMTTFFIGIPNLSTMKFKTTGQLVYAVCSILFFCYNLYNSIKTSVRTKKVLLFVRRKLTCFNKFIDIITELNDIIPLIDCSIPSKINMECSRGQMMLDYLQLPKKEVMVELFRYIGKIDLYQMCNYLTKMNYTFVREIKSKQPIIYFKGMTLPGNNVLNDFYMNGKNSIITGPNAGGKTTFMRSILVNVILAQTLGISCCKKMIFSKFDMILTNIVKKDDHLSLFQREMTNLAAIIEKAKTHKCLIAIDEMCSSTNVKEGSLIAYNISKKLGETNSLTLITTHLDSLKELEEKERTYLNYHMEIERVNGRVNYLYKIKRGMSNEMTALDNINNLSIDIKKTK